VRAYDVNKALIDEKEVHYLVMEYVEGQDLRRIVESQGALDYSEAADLIWQAAEGLAHAHARGLVHRDIKPANLLVDTEGVVKILDLGLVKFFDDERHPSLTDPHEKNVLGTVDYMAPEQARNSHDVDARADIYSLGHTFYFLLTGHPPFPEGTAAERLHAHQTKSPEPIRYQRPDVPSRLVAIISKMTAKRPGLRYQTTIEVTKALARWLDEGTEDGSRGTYSSPSVRGSSPSRSSRHGATQSRLAASEETELELAPMDDEKPLAELSGSSSITAGTDSKQSESKGDVPSSTADVDAPSMSSSGSAHKGPEGGSVAELLEELPELPELENGLMAAVPENGPTGPPTEGGSLAAPLSRQGPSFARAREKAEPRGVVTVLLESAWFWIGVAVLVVVVLIVAMLYVWLSTGADQVPPRMGQPSVPAPPGVEQASGPSAELPQAPAVKDAGVPRSPAPSTETQPPEHRPGSPDPVDETVDAAPADMRDKGDAATSRPSSETTKEAQEQRSPKRPRRKPGSKKAAEAKTAVRRRLLAGLTEFSCRLESFDPHPQSKFNLMVERQAEEAAKRIGLKVTESDAAVMHVKLKADNVEGQVKIVVSARLECRTSGSKVVDVWRHAKQIGFVPPYALQHGNLHLVLRKETGQFFRQFTRDCQDARAEIHETKRRRGKTP
ncbi:MAG: serine/threonine protein kinase, partial [Planctomycetota bacterium]